MSNLNRHVKSDQIKWAVTTIILILIIIMIAGLCMQVFAKDDKYKPSEWFTKTECEHVYGTDGKCEKCGESKPAEDNPAEDNPAVDKGFTVIPECEHVEGENHICTKCGKDLSGLQSF